ncbi:hypothetical protein F4804DRAFT_316840 [Jackrogersella minutella]|nr:hypothetical protein F4804DRAFT_316840 [Jackrogersella minutella]
MLKLEMSLLHVWVRVEAITKEAKSTSPCLRFPPLPFTLLLFNILLDLVLPHILSLIQLSLDTFDLFYLLVVTRYYL